MAVSIEAAFVLLDKASKPLRDIRREALLTDKALRSMGSGTGGLGGTSTSSNLRSFTQDLESMRKVSKAAGEEIKETGKKVESAGGFFRRNIRHIKDWTKAFVQAHPVLKGFVGTLGGLVGGLKGAAGAFPPMVWAVLAAAPAVVALTGAVTALVSSLGMAVGGGALLGGGLLGSFVVGLGSVAAVAKPAITATQNYEKAVKNLNTAIASGSPTMIKRRQKELDAIAKANPGVKQLAGNLKSFESAWKKATAPGRASFFKLANDGIGTMRKLLPTLASEANKNTAALESSFRKILAPFLESSTFKGFVSGLGGIFRANLPGFMQGLVNVFTGLANILKTLTPQLEKAGPAFEKFTGKFAKWTGTAGGARSVLAMGDAFKNWLNLLKQIFRLIGVVMGVAGPKGTGIIAGWADRLQKLVDNLQKPGGKRGLESFFTRALSDADKLAGLLKPIAKDLAAIYTAFKPLGSVTAFVIKHLPGPALAAAMWAFVGFKGAKGAVSGVKTTVDLFTKTRGSTVANPLFTWQVNGGGGGGGGPGVVPTGGAKGEKEAEGFFRRTLKKLPGGEKLLERFPRAAGLLEKTLPVVGKASIVLAGVTALAAGLTTKGDVPRRLRAVLNTVIPGLFTEGPPKQQVDPRYHSPFGGGPLPRSDPKQLLGGGSGAPGGPFVFGGATPKPVPGLPPILSGGGGLLGVAQAFSGATTAITNNMAYLARRLGPHFNTPVQKALHKAQDDFTKMAKSAGGSLDDINKTAVTTSDDIRKKLPKDSAATNQAVATNYAIAAGDVETSMNRHVIAVDTAMKAIATLMAKAFEALGIKSDVAGKLAKSGATLHQVTSGQSSGRSAGLVSGGDYNAKSIGAGSGSYQYASGGRLPGRPQGDHLPLLGRGGKLLGIADGGELVVNRHTEAKADRFLASFGTRLSDLVANETTPHFARGGRTSSTRSFAMGGAIGYGGLEGLWNRAGGPSNKAALMAAIAMAESGGRPSAHNPSGATGLWQILGNPFPGNAYDPLTNARMAVAKFQSQGLGAWEAYTNGAYRQFLKGGIPPGGWGGAGAVPTLKAPTVGGTGAVTAYGQAVINRVTRAANQYLQANAPGAMGGAGGGTVPGGKGVVMDPSGKPVAGWIEPILQWARQHGWSGSVSSGYRSFAEQSAIYNSGVRPAAVPGTSNHEGSVFPRGAVDVTGAAQLSAVLSHSPYGSTLVWAGAKDPVHFSHPHGGSYALGGRVPWFANGTDFIANRPQVIGVGDRPGGERVTVTPKGQAGRIGNQGLHVEIHHIEVNRKGDVQKIVDEELQLLAATIERNL